MLQFALVTGLSDYVEMNNAFYFFHMLLLSFCSQSSDMNRAVTSSIFM